MTSLASAVVEFRRTANIPPRSARARSPFDYDTLVATDASVERSAHGPGRAPALTAAAEAEHQAGASALTRFRQ
jgi:hypothetical protein